MNTTKDTDVIKQRVQAWIVSGSCLILIAKFGAYYLTNSVGILTDAMESIVNVLAGLISLYSLRLAAKPRDKSHPFGHGKIELISASIEGLLIILAGSFIVYEGALRLVQPSTIQKLDIGILVVALGGVCNYLMGWYSVRIGKRHSSVALQASGRHLQSDTYSTIGLVVGLVLLRITGVSWIDGALALVFGGVIMVTGFQILRKTIANLTDKADVELLQSMVQAIEAARHHDWVDIHNMKVIKYGSYLFVDCDLTLPWYYIIRQSHQATDHLEQTIIEHLQGHAQVSVHTDPCQAKDCMYCTLAACPHRQHPFQARQPFSLASLTQSDEDRCEGCSDTDTHN